MFAFRTGALRLQRWHRGCTWCSQRRASRASTKAGSLIRKILAVLSLGFSPLLLLGCLSNSYEIKRDELERLAAIAPENRWQSVRAVQRIGGDDYPPEDDSAIGTGPTGHVYVSTVVIDSHHHYHYPPRRSVTRPVAEASAGNTRTL